MVRVDPAARPGRRHEQAQPAAQREQDGEGRNRPGCPVHQSGEQSRRPDNGAKRAQIGKASDYTHRSFRPDAARYMSVTTATHRPTVTHPDTRRDKKEAARRAAFPQLRAVFAGGGRSRVRTWVGEADGFADRLLESAIFLLTWLFSSNGASGMYGPSAANGRRGGAAP